MTAPADPSLQRYRRLDAFLRALQGDVYAEPASLLHDGVTRRMFEKLQQDHPLAAGSTVLDIGCGQGTALELFRAASLEGVGISLGEDVEVCRAKGLNVLEMDFSFLDFTDGAFDLVWCRHALEHSIFPFFTLSEIRRVLKPGGRLYLEMPAPDTACGHQTNPNHYSVLGKSMWIELIRRAGFADIRCLDLALTTTAGPDLYWAFTQRRAA
jgi:SAM-dependent methyltransferase